MRTLTTLGVGTALAFGLASGTGDASAYTEGEDVIIYAGVISDDCATATWPRGYEEAFCGTERARQGPVTVGDRFGVKVTSYMGGDVYCSVYDAYSGDLIVRRYGYNGQTANCMMRAVRRSSPPPSGNGSLGS